MVGRTIAHYQIEEKLGQGGMGTVFRAIDLNLGRSVAIKFLSAEIADERQRRRFQQEAQTASSLNHPHILTVFEAGSIDGEQYLVTEYIDGFTLRQWAKQTQPAVKTILELMTGIAGGLAAAHDAGILHRDIKPENILVFKNGHAKLVDFGLAKLLEPLEPPTSQDSTLTGGVTRPGVILGTIAYMSPEQAAGRPTDARSDIFSLGVVLYELLAGRRPFGGPSDLGVLQATRESVPEPLETLRPDLPPDLWRILEKTLEKDPADRYQFMLELAVDLRRAQKAKIYGPAVEVGRKGSRPRWFALGAAAMLLLLVPLMLSLRRQATPTWVSPLANAEFTRLTDWEGAELDAAISPDGKFAAFLSDRDGIFDAWISQIGSGTFVNLTKGRFPALVHEFIGRIGFSGDGSYIWFCVVDLASKGGLSTGAIWVVPAMAGGAPRPFLSAGGMVSWSRDGNRIVYFDGVPGDPTFIADANGANPRPLMDDRPAGHLHFPIWSPSGQFIYFQKGPGATSRQDIWRIPAEGGTAQRITYHDARVGYPILLDERTLLFTGVAADGSGPWLYAQDVDQKLSHRISQGIEHYTSVSASADGRRLAAAISNPSAGLWTIPITEKAQSEPAAARVPVSTVSAVSPRYGPGYILYLSSTGGSNGLWKYGENVSTELWSGTKGAVAAAAAISPDGRQICVPILKNGKGTLHLMTSDGTDPRSMADNLDVRQAPSWSPDGNWIAVAATPEGEQAQNNRIFLVPVKGGDPVRLTDHLSHTPVWSPDGRMIAYAKQMSGASVQLAAVTPDKQPVPMPELFVAVGGERFRFLPDSSGIVVMQGEFRRLNFWLLDLKNGHRRQITNFKVGPLLRSFDISRDGKQILFDRIQENSDIVLIDLKQ